MNPGIINKNTDSNMQAESHTVMFNEIFVIMESCRIDFPVGFVDSHVSLYGKSRVTTSLIEIHVLREKN